MIDIGFSSSSPLDQENVNTDTFITFFGIIYSAKTIITNLANHSFEHAITKSNPDLNYHKSNLFTYITSKRYISDEYSGIMIDTGASKWSIVGYEQFFVYKKKIKHV